MIPNVLKKYSRAAGDRIQWRKVDAMSCELSCLDQTAKAPERESFEGQGRAVSRDDRLNMRCRGQII